MAEIEGFCTPGVYDPPNYTQAIKVTDAQTILFLSGQVAREPDGRVAHRGDFTGQVRSALQAIKALVEATGGTMDSIVKLNTYVTDVRYRDYWRMVYGEFFPRRLPAYTLLQVSSLAQPDWFIEIEAIAVL
jgi:2-iminobutanoate/2-iminopropanoate deaminase